MVNIIGIFIITLIVLLGFSKVSIVHAAETESNYLPKGWTSLSNNSNSISPIVKQNSLLESKILGGPAPGLTSLQIIDLAVDENNEIHVVTKEMGTSRSSIVYWNGDVCKENQNETQYITNSAKIVVGYIKYFHTGLYYTPSLAGAVEYVSAESTNAMNPWNTLSASKTFTIPKLD